MVHQVQKDPKKKKATFIYLKNIQIEKRSYLDLARKLADLYEEVNKKAKILKEICGKILEG